MWLLKAIHAILFKILLLFLTKDGMLLDETNRLKQTKLGYLTDNFFNID